MNDVCSSDSPPVAPEIDGWEARYFGDEPRLSEQVELYKELGFKVRLEPLKPEMCDGCVECFKDSMKPFSILYVRKMPENKQASGDDDLF